MKKSIVIEYDVIDGPVGVIENELSTFESFGVLEAAKTMIAADWIADDER